MKKLQYLLLSIVLVFGANSIFAKSISQTEAPGLLFKISGKDLKKPSYIFGTIHLVCQDDLFSMENLGSRLSETEKLILELDMDDPEVMQKAAGALNMPEGKKLNELLTPEKYAKVDELFKLIYGMPVSSLATLSPFGLQTVVGMSSKSTGCNIPASYEMKFVELAKAAKMPVEGLESVEDQMAAVFKTPIEKQAEDLYKLSLEPEKTLGGFKLLLAEYLKKDAEALTTFIAKQSAEDPEFQTNMLDERNKKWIPKIEKAIAEKPTFFAVGGGHLGGENGVIKLLRRQGYTVSAVQF